MFTRRFLFTVLLAMLLVSLLPLYELFLAKEPDWYLINRSVVFLCAQIPVFLLFHFLPAQKSDSEYLSYRYGWLWDNTFSANKSARKKLALALQYFDIQKYSRTLKIIKRLQKRRSQLSDKRILSLLEGLCYTADRQPKKAIRHFSGMQHEAPYDAVLPAFLALNYITLGDYSSAKESCEKALRYEPDNPWGYICYALLSFQLHDFYAVAEYGSTARKLGAEISILYFILFISYKKIGMTNACYEVAELYYSKIRYEENADPRMHLRNKIEQRHYHYLGLEKKKKKRKIC